MMGDRNDHLFFNHHPKFNIDLQAHEEVEAELLREKTEAAKQALLAEAYRQMPEDLRARASEWGISALMELVWLNGWDCGYRQSNRDRKAMSEASRTVGNMSEMMSDEGS